MGVPEHEHDGELDGVPRPATSSVPGVEVLAATGLTRAVVLVLHGGKAVSKDPSRPRHLSALRMVPFARRIHRLSRADGVATWLVRYRYRGWNGAEASPAQDARWALEEVRRRHGDVPVVLLGHSMGGRTVLRVADDPAVHTVVALAPWLPADESVASVRDRRVLIAHAARDRWTSPAASYAWWQRARPLTAQATYVRVRRSGHFMLRRSGVWSSLAAAFVLDGLPRITVTSASSAGSTGRAGHRSVRGPGTNLLVAAAAGAGEMTA